MIKQANDDKIKIRNDIILIGFLLLIVGVISYFLYFNNSQNEASSLQLQILIDGELTDTYELTDEAQKIILDTGNVIVIEERQVYMKDASCPDGLCMKQGHISRAGESIICLPHKLVLRLVDNATNSNTNSDTSDSSSDSNGLDVMPR